MRSIPDAGFDRNVFINCPFDPGYQELLRPLLFVIVYLGFRPKIALERSDSGEQRINKICELIAASKYSIHDLSRIRSRSRNEFYRLNMPFELGIEYGSRRFSQGRLKQKRCLILGRERYDFMKALSDLSGVDIKNHNDDPGEIVREVRNWFFETVGLRSLASPASIWFDFNEFMFDFYGRRKLEGFSDEDVNKMPVLEFVSFVDEWVSKSRNL